MKKIVDPFKVNPHVINCISASGRLEMSDLVYRITFVKNIA